MVVNGAIGTSVAARIEGTVANRFARKPDAPDQDIRLMQPSGVMTMKPVVTKGAVGWTAERVGVYRTHRRLFDGYVYLPASKVPRMAERERKLSSAAE